ncbi:MAG: lipid-A-disaccharide synthase [Alphaproteobacteria bacterium]|nr:lipid-A-disaccharide synthase [Alphaproteobacteria bacterium]
MTQYTIFLSAGEPSGDFLGSQLMKALKKLLGDSIKFTGIGGPLMTAEGLTSLFPMEELSVMGFAEVLPHIWRIKKRIQQTVEAIETQRPDAVVTIDSPGFNFRVGKALKKRIRSIPLIHYTAPSVWAWRAKRAKSIAKFLDHLLVLFPFEPLYFEKEGLPTTFVGHPVVEMNLSQKKDLTFRDRHRIPYDVPLLTLLPGSRRAEVTRLLPVFQKTVFLLQKKIPNLHIVIPTLPHLEKFIREKITFSATITTEQSEKFAAFQESQAALAASGTVVLELAAAGLPMVIAYKLHPLTYFLIRRMIKIKYASLVNILMGQEVVSELIQDKCIAPALCAAVESLLTDKAKEKQMRQRMNEVIKKLKPPADYQSPSLCAAHSVFNLTHESTISSKKQISRSCMEPSKVT